VLARSTLSELEQSSGEPCEDAILDEATRPGVLKTNADADIDVYGTMAQARYPKDTLFLTRFRSGWRVMAAGCEARTSVDGYDCTVKGG
jgi:hypothetical protein